MGARRDDREFRERCRRQMDRPLALRIKYGFCRVYRPVLDDAPWRAFDSTAEYRTSCAAHLPADLGCQLEPGKRHAQPLRTAREIAPGKVPPRRRGGTR